MEPHQGAARGIRSPAVVANGSGATSSGEKGRVHYTVYLYIVYLFIDLSIYIYIYIYTIDMDIDIYIYIEIWIFWTQNLVQRRSVSFCVQSKIDMDIEIYDSLYLYYMILYVYIYLCFFRSGSMSILYDLCIFISMSA